ncbi:autotransporter outer membrane beta-barrel domain-containing protein [Achromobacter aloeverae]
MSNRFKRRELALLLSLLGAGAACAAPEAHAATQCPGNQSQFSADALDASKVPAARRAAGGHTVNVNAGRDCDTFLANGGQLNVQAGGATGNILTQQDGQVVVQNGGTVNGIIAAGNTMQPAAGSPPAAYGQRGDVTLQPHATVAGILIGEDSTLTADGADVGWIKSAGTTTLNDVQIEPSAYALGTPGLQYDAGLEVNGGTTSVSDSVVYMLTDAMDDPHATGIAVHGDNAYAGGQQIDVHILGTAVTSGTALSIARDGAAPDEAYDVELKGSRFLGEGPAGGPSGTGAYVSVTGGTQAVAIVSEKNVFEGSSGLQFIASDGNTRFTDTGSRFSGDNAQATQNPHGAGVGIYAAGNGQLALSGSTVRGKNDGIQLDTLAGGDGATLSLTDGTHVQGTGGAALHIVNHGGNADAVAHVLIASGSTLDTAQGNGDIIQADGGGKADVTADAVALNGNIAAADTDTALDVYARNGASLTGAFSAAGGATLGMGAADARLNGTVEAGGAGTHAIVQLDAGGVLDGGVALSGKAQGTVSVAGAGSLLSRADGAAVEVDDSDATIAVRDGGRLQGRDGMLVNVADGGSAQVLLADTTQQGDMAASADSRLDLTLAGSAVLDGNVSGKNGSVVLRDHARLNGDVGSPAVVVADAATLNGDLDGGSLTLAGEGTWELGGAPTENLDTLVMNGGDVDFNSGAGGFKTLKAASLGGAGGTLSMNVDFNPGGGNDLLQVDTVDGAHGLRVNADQGVAHPRNDITLVQAGGGAGSFRLVGDGKTDAGIYVYEVRQNGGQWQLVQTGTVSPTDPTDPTNPSDPTNPVNPDNPVNPVNPADPRNDPIPKPRDLSPAAKTALSMASSLPYAFYGELDTLRQREGDLRMNKAGSGVWVRSFANSNKMAQSTAPAYRLDQYGGAFGADRRFALSSGGDVYAGGFGSYSYDTSAIDGGSTGRVNSVGVGAYATWLSQGGWYVDGALKANSFGNELRVVGSDGARSRGKYDRPGYGGSVEAGRHFDLSGKGYVEPYTQIAAFQAGSAGKTLDSGFRIHDAPTRSVRGQLGFQAGAAFTTGKGYLIQPYVKAAVLREFVNSNRVSLNGATLSDNLNGNRALVGMGLQAQFKRNLQVYADVDYTSGGPVDHSVDGDLGLRYVF